MSEYTSKYNVMFFNATLNASEKFKFYLDGTYTRSEGSFTSFGELEADDQVANQDLDFSETDEYSDLDFTLLELIYGVSFQVDTNARLYSSVTYMELTDDQPYVYGDQDGKVTFYSAGMTVGF
jgi:hypothetical protein